MVHLASRSSHTLGMTTRKFFVLAILAAGGVQAAQPQGGPSRFREIDGIPSKVDVSRLASRRVEQPVKVIVVMSEPSVAGMRALSAARSISEPEQDAIKQRVRAQHQWIRPSLEGYGAKVLGEFHGAINGMKIEVQPSKIASIAALPGVVSVLPVPRHHRDNVNSVPYIGTPYVWQLVPGLRGEGVKVGIIDTGIDYTHANFGGPGTVAAYQAAAAASTGPADPALFGPSAPKVKGGIDLAGDDYDANTPGSVPKPDPNPLDCALDVGHGSHVAGTVAGFGVTSAGTTYNGPYNKAAYSPGAFNIGPGVAPKADLYAIRVFGCNGSTDLVVEAIEWAVNNGMNVINMSLGSDFGSGDTADSLAASNAAKAGVIVVASAGNSGPAPYISGSPATGDGVISVAAIDGQSSFSGAILTLPGGKTFNAQDSNVALLPAGPTGVVVLRNADGTVSLGCSAAEYAGVAGKLVVTLRGTCDRIQRAKFGQAAGARAVAMINNAAGFPPFEGPIPGVTIPFLGITPNDATALVAATSVTSMVSATIANPSEGMAASFSSGGPRFGDSAFKPNVSAPGVSVFSTLVGSGNGALALSGTSMAAPHVAGVGALTRQAHPGWNERTLAAAIVQTADPSRLHDYSARIEGSGLVQPLGATQTQAVAFADDRLATAVSFGFAEFTRNFTDSRELRIVNKGSAPITFNVTTLPSGGAPHTVELSRPSVALRGGDDALLKLTLSVPAGSAGASHDDFGNAAFQEVAGFVTLTPTSPSMNGGVTLRVPYYLVQRARSKLTADLGNDFGSRSTSSQVRLANRGTAVAAHADFYALGLVGSRQGVAPYDVRAVGVQSFPLTATDNLLVFAVNTFERFNHASTGEIDIFIDTTGDGTPDYDVFIFDYGLLTTGSYSGDSVVGILNLSTGTIRLRYFADAPTDGSTLLAPVRASDLGLSTAQSKFSYHVNFFNLSDGTSGAVPGVASFDAFTPAISNGMFVTVPPGQNASVPVQINSAQWAKTPARGLMVVNQENASGGDQALLLQVWRGP